MIKIHVQFKNSQLLSLFSLEMKTVISLGLRAQVLILQARPTLAVVLICHVSSTPGILVYKLQSKSRQQMIKQHDVLWRERDKSPSSSNLFSFPGPVLKHNCHLYYASIDYVTDDMNLFCLFFQKFILCSLKDKHTKMMLRKRSDFNVENKSSDKIHFMLLLDSTNLLKCSKTPGHESMTD